MQKRLYSSYFSVHLPSNSPMDHNRPQGHNEHSIARKSANYEPSKWDYSSIQALTSHYTEEAYGPLAEKLKEEVRGWFGGDQHWPQLQLIDDIQRLGLGYHFEKEIRRALNDLFADGYHNNVQNSGLHATAVCFRLFRQYGFMVSEEIFNHFKDKNGSFMASLFDDMRGLLSLYQASYLAFDGENIIEAARAFALERLKEADTSCLSGEVAHALELPSHWMMTRLEALWYIDIYERGDSMNSTLLQLAKLDFNMVQSKYLKELKAVTSWWMNMGLVKRINFIRDRIMETFLGVMIIVPYPQYGYCREELTKVGMLITMVDDVYDNFGSLDELKLFSHVIERWEVTSIEKLPKSMKIAFYAIFNTTNKIAYDIKRYNGCEVLHILKKAWADLCNTFLVEAKWQNDQFKPTLEEYLNNGWISVSGPLILYFVHSLLINSPTNEALQCLERCTELIRLPSMIFRLCNDLATSKAEQESGYVPTSIDCYMRESGVSEIIARGYIKSMINDTWKEMNKEFQSCSSLPKPFIDACMNLARMANCLYQHGDGYGIENHKVKGHIKSLLFKPLSLEEKFHLNSF